MAIRRNCFEGRKNRAGMLCARLRCVGKLSSLVVLQNVCLVHEKHCLADLSYETGLVKGEPYVPHVGGKHANRAFMMNTMLGTQLL